MNTINSIRKVEYHISFSHMIATASGSLRRGLIAYLDSVIRKLGKILVKPSHDRMNEIIRRNKIRENGTHWFIEEEASLLSMLAQIIVPSDEISPGANEIDVLGLSAVNVIDKLVAGSKEKQALYTIGLITIDEFSERVHKKKLRELSYENQKSLLNHLDIYRIHFPATSTITGKIRKKTKEYFTIIKRMRDGTYPAVELFPVLIQDVLGAFYTSEVSWIWLGYDGPPMPDGYSDLHVNRPRRRGSGRGAMEELAALGYGTPMPNVKPRGEPTDVVIIGSGAGGGVVAKELSEAGLSVVVVEAGKRFNPYTDYNTAGADFELKARNVFDPDDERRDLYTFTGPNMFHYHRVKGVGGTTLKYLACKPRFHETDFRTRTEDGLAEDWPISYEDLEPFYTRVEYELGVSGPTGPEANPFDPPRSRPFPTPAHKFNLASLAIKRGADKLGLHLVREPLGIPTVEWDGRPACINAGTCMLGCAITAKSSMDVTYLRKAEKTGRLDIRSDCMARQVTVNSEGKARGVIYIDREGQEHEIRTRAVVLAANAVETPRLLLMSKSKGFPDGLGNSSGLVGRYFFEHISAFASGLLPDRIDPWRGTPTGGMMQDYYATNKANGFARGWTTYVLCGEQWPLTIAKNVPGWGEEHKRRTQQCFAHSLTLASVGEQLPDFRNRVTLDSRKKDLYGLPVPCLTNELGDNDRAMIKAIKERFREILEAAGATEIHADFKQGYSSHYMGTCRMGVNPEYSVVDEWGRAHDVPNLYIADSSVFVTGAAVNPSLTISALATRISFGIIKAFKRREL